jgi:hypothetical protein
MVATFETERSCPYHGGWIRLADCPIVATNGVVISELASSNGHSHDESDAEVPVSPDAARVALRSVRAREGALKFTPGRPLTSKVDGVPRTIVADPPVPPAPPVKRRFVPRDRRAPVLPSPAALASEYGGQRGRPVRACPDPGCLHPLPSTIDSRDPISIALVGNSQASKTTTVAALLAGLRRHGPEALGVKTFSPSETTFQHVRDVLQGYMRRHNTAQTHASRFHAPLEFNTELGPYQTPVTVLVHDVAGEDLMDSQLRLRWAPYVLWADVILFLYNPEESPRLSLLESSTEQAAVLTGVLDDLEAEPPRDYAGGDRWPPLVVAVSKADLLPNPPNLAAGPLPDEAVQQALFDLQEGNVVHAARRWSETHWRFIAPLPPSGEAEGVLELFKLVLDIAAS